MISWNWSPATPAWVEISWNLTRLEEEETTQSSPMKADWIVGAEAAALFVVVALVAVVVFAVVVFLLVDL